MPLFIWDRCHCVDNTATSDFWLQARAGSAERLCTECRTGTWHDCFPKAPHAGQRVIWPKDQPPRPPTSTSEAGV
jgi:hypothetical protein